MNEHVIMPEDIKLPLPASGVSVLHGETSTFLIYPTYYGFRDKASQYILVECEELSLSRFGYPNDEGLGEHRLYNKGLKDVNGLAEVKNSELLAEYENMIRRSCERIWGGRGMLSQVPCSPSGKRHFVLSFKENVFEAICDTLRVVGVFSSYSEAFDELRQMIKD
jgi:hypothetical protein